MLFGAVSKTNKPVQTLCQMRSLNEIECETPLGMEAGITLPVSLLVNRNIILTKFNYTFLSPFHQKLYGLNEFKSNESLQKTNSFFKNIYSIFSDAYKNIKNRVLNH
jgi:hypothetical protein